MEAQLPLPDITAHRWCRHSFCPRHARPRPASPGVRDQFSSIRRRPTTSSAPNNGAQGRQESCCSRMVRGCTACWPTISLVAWRRTGRPEASKHNLSPAFHHLHLPDADYAIREFGEPLRLDRGAMDGADQRWCKPAHRGGETANAGRWSCAPLCRSAGWRTGLGISAPRDLCLPAVTTSCMPLGRR
jgi:hypothetical protein